jgi:hypothetical protein
MPAEPLGLLSRVAAGLFFRLNRVGGGAMQRLWSAEELVEHWSLTPEELALLPGKADAGKLGFAVQLAFYKRHAN